MPLGDGRKSALSFSCSRIQDSTCPQIRAREVLLCLLSLELNRRVLAIPSTSYSGIKLEGSVQALGRCPTPRAQATLNLRDVY